MAEEIVFDIAKGLIAKVGSYAFQEIQKFYGVRDDLEDFQKSLSIVKGVILDADEEKREKNHAMEAWLTNVKDIVYDADDLLDELAFQDLRRTLFKGQVATKVCDFFSSSNQILFRCKVGHRMKKLREDLNTVKNDVAILNLSRKDMIVGRYEPNFISQRETDSRQTLGIIGREKDKKNVVDSLLCVGGEGNVSVVAIVGLGGLGKTTLAQMVYNDRQVDEYFKLKIWVCVSEEFEVKLLLKKILKCITRIEENLDLLEPLQIQLGKNLGGKRYLLVLDDVWNEDRQKWDDLKKYLLDGAPGCKILVTTRSQSVATIMGVKSPYMLQGLDNSQGWNLFEQVAFREGSSSIVSREKIRIGKEIVKKCKGVPLVIRSIGSLMQFKIGENEWLFVLENDLWRSCDSRGDFIPALKLSYDHLPIPLKQCFTYCAMFPKDYEFDKEKLICLWMAQGYIVGLNRNQCLEDIGEQYFNELLFRSFFQFSSRRLSVGPFLVSTNFIEESGRQYYKMHDLIHDLAQSIVKDSCIAVEEGKIETISERVQHLYCSQSHVDSLKGVNGLRTLDTRETDRDLSKCQRLRALIISMEMMMSAKALSSIGKLKHLRYLHISNYSHKRLPKSIINLHNLQTLIIIKCSNLRELPRDINYLISLRCLIIEGCSYLQGMPMTLGKLTGLQRLSYFKADISGRGRYCKLNELEHLNQLSGELTIGGLGDVRSVELESKKVNLFKKDRLQFLILRFEGVNNRMLESEMMLENLQPHPNLQILHVYGYKGVRFSNWLPRITSLVTIRLLWCTNLKQIPALDQLPSLKTLHLFRLEWLEYISDDEDDGDSSSTFFPSLQEIEIKTCHSFMGWWRRRNRSSGLCQFPRLSRLCIENCRSFASLTDGMPPLASVKNLEISRCSHQLSERCEKEKGEDWPYISHIPNIIFNGRLIQSKDI